MTPVETINVVCRFLEENLANMRPDERKITVYPYALPEPEPARMAGDAASTPEDYEDMMPAVIVAPISFEDKAFSDGSSLMTVSLLFGAHSRDSVDGPQCVINMLERVRRVLFTSPVLEDSCELLEPLSWQMYDETTSPLWFGEMITQWHIAVPERTDWNREYDPVYY